MTTFIPFGTPPGATGNPKTLIADEFVNGETQIFVRTTGTASDGKSAVVDSAVVTVDQTTEIGSVVIAGNTTPDVDTTITYNVTTPDATDPGPFTYTWSVSGGAFDIITGPYPDTQLQVQFEDGDTAYTVQCVVSSSSPSVSDSPATGTLSVTSGPGFTDWDGYSEIQIRTAMMNGSPTATYDLSAPVGAFTKVMMDQSSRVSDITGVDDVDYTPYALGGEYKTRVMQGNTNEFETTYDYMAVYNPRADIALSSGGGQYGAPETVGWMVYVREKTQQDWENFKMSFLPLENSGSGFIPGVPYDESMRGVTWANSGNTVANTVTFFNGYTPGDILNWSAPS